jgi:hypothetical protein
LQYYRPASQFSENSDSLQPLAHDEQRGRDQQCSKKIPECDERVCNPALIGFTGDLKQHVALTAEAVGDVRAGKGSCNGKEFEPGRRHLKSDSPAGFEGDKGSEPDGESTRQRGRS